MRAIIYPYRARREEARAAAYWVDQFQMVLRQYANGNWTARHHANAVLQDFDSEGDNGNARIPPQLGPLQIADKALGEIESLSSDSAVTEIATEALLDLQEAEPGLPPTLLACARHLEDLAYEPRRISPAELHAVASMIRAIVGRK